MLKYIVGVIAIIIVLAGAYYYLVMSQTPLAPEVQAPEVQVPTTSTYATSTYSVQYPPEFILDENYAYDQFGPTKLIHGVRFAIPETMATGTTLSADSYVAIEQLPRAQNCTADIYLKQDVKAVAFTEDGTAYSIATSSEAAAGSTYEEMVFALPDSSPCTAVRYRVHSTNIGNYPAGTVQEFDRTALLAAFDTIRRSLQVSSMSQPAATSPSLQP